MRCLLAGLVLLMFSVGVGAEQDVRGEGFVVHYSAINTNALPPDVAERLGVKRRASHALILLSPRREASDEPAAAVASGTVRRLTGQRQDLAWRAVASGAQQDLIAEFEILDGERLAFDISVKPEGASYPLVVRFNQQFYRE